MDPCCVWKWWFHHKHVDLRNKMWEENGIIWKTTWYLGVSENGESPNLVQNRSQLHGFLVLTRWILGFGRQTIAKKQLWKSGWFFLWKWSTDPWRIHGAGIYANIGGILMVNVTIYSIHGSYGIMIGLKVSWKAVPFFVFFLSGFMGRLRWLLELKMAGVSRMHGFRGIHRSAATVASDAHRKMA